jgi:hypothetical protein
VVKVFVVSTFTLYLLNYSNRAMFLNIIRVAEDVSLFNFGWCSY